MPRQSNGLQDTYLDPHYCKELPSKIDYERVSPYIAFTPHEVIQHTLRQTAQLAKSTDQRQFQVLRRKRLHEFLLHILIFLLQRQLKDTIVYMFPLV
jgi:hypothetical protein